MSALRNLLLLALLVAPVFALTASPASFETKLHTGEDRYFITVRNDEERSLAITLTPTGPLSALITVQPSLTLAPGTSVQVPITLSMPQSTQPGVLESGILIESRPLSAGTVAAASAVMHVIRVETPREGSFVSGELLSSAGIAGSTVSVTLILTNTGTEAIRESTGNLQVGSENRDFTIDLAPGETRSYVAAFLPERVGIYDAEATVRYAGKEAHFTTTITVGSLNVSIAGVDVGEFRLGDPFRVSLLVYNQWGASLPVAGSVSITQTATSNVTRVVSTARSTSVKVDSLASAAIPLFLESTTMLPGPGELNATVTYADRTVTQSYPIYVSVDALLLGAREPAVAHGSWWLLLALVMVILGCVLWYVRRRAPRTKPREEDR